MKTLLKSTLVCSLLLAAQLCRAQIDSVAASTSCKSSIIGVYASTNTPATYVADWSTFGSGGSGTVSAYTASTVGNNVGTVAGCGLWNAGSTSYPFYNGSLRSAIQGSNYGTIDNYARYTVTPSAHTYTVTVWGPTLNQFGVHGATNFRWEIYVYNSSGSVVQFISAAGETNNYTVNAASGTPYIDVRVYATDPNENGEVIAMVNG